MSASSRLRLPPGSPSPGREDAGRQGRTLASPRRWTSSHVFPGNSRCHSSPSCFATVFPPPPPSPNPGSQLKYIDCPRGLTPSPPLCSSESELKTWSWVGPASSYRPSSEAHGSREAWEHQLSRGETGCMIKGLSTLWPAATGRPGRASRRPGAVRGENTVSPSCVALRGQHHPLLPTQSSPEGSAASHGGSRFVARKEGWASLCMPSARDSDLCVCVFFY